MNADRRVVITGMGALSALGDADGLWNGLLAGRSGVRRITHYDVTGLPCTVGGCVPNWDGVPVDMVDSIMALSALIDAAVHAGIQQLRQAGLQRNDCGLCWGASLDTYQPWNDGTCYLSSTACFGKLSEFFASPRRMIATACAAGTQALGEAYRLIRSGRANAIMAGGSSVMLTPLYLLGFTAIQAMAQDQPGDDPAAICRPFDRLRRGLVLADGAAALVVESWESAQQRGAAPLAEIVGFGVSQDGFDLNRPPADGAGAELAIRRALVDGGLDPPDIDAINAHGTGTVSGDPAEATALRRVLGERWRTTPVSSIKGAIGHAMGAAGALGAVVAIRSCQTGLVPPTVNLREPDVECALDHVIGTPRDADCRTVLSLSCGMGGQNAAILFRRIGDRRT